MVLILILYFVKRLASFILFPPLPIAKANSSSVTTAKASFFFSSVIFTIAFLAAPYETTNPLLYNLLVIPVLIILFVSIGIVVSMEFSFGSFECKHCGNKFMPKVKDYILGPHGPTTRQLKCPKCGKTSFCKRRLTK